MLWLFNIKQTLLEWLVKKKLRLNITHYYQDDCIFQEHQIPTIVKTCSTHFVVCVQKMNSHSIQTKHWVYYIHSIFGPRTRHIKNACQCRYPYIFAQSSRNFPKYLSTITVREKLPYLHCRV